MSSPLVSIVLPTYNRLKYLRPAIDSVLEQTFGDWELIVADDGSEEETATYLAALADPPRITVLRLPHTGSPGAVRNAAWQAARGEYIAFLDSDDVWLPEKLALQVASLQSHPERGWSNTSFAVIDDSGTLLTGARARWWPAMDGGVLESLIKMKTSIALPSVMVRRQLLAQVGGFDVALRMCEDYDLWLRLAPLSEIHGVRETLLHVRNHRERFHKDPIVFEDLGRAFTKALGVSANRGVHSILRRARAKAAASLARSQAISGDRWAALRTLARSFQYSSRYREWWMEGGHAAARAIAPEGILRIARSIVRRRRGITPLQE
jgi:glycosyltransferase involved in cell wall biosynthesis